MSISCSQLSPFFATVLSLWLDMFLLFVQQDGFGYVAAFSGLQFAATSFTKFVANQSYIVSSLTLVRITVTGAAVSTAVHLGYEFVEVLLCRFWILTKEDWRIICGRMIIAQHVRKQTLRLCASTEKTVPFH